MSAFSAAVAILMQAHGAVSVSETAPGISQELDKLLINNINPDPQRNEIIKTGGMGEEALTLLNRPTYELGIDCEQTDNSGPWANRHPGEVLTYASLTLYTAMTDIQHKFPTGSGCSWSVKSPKQSLRAGDLRKADYILKLLFRPTLSAIAVDAAAVA